jgi:hypothetical protein
MTSKQFVHWARLHERRSWHAMHGWLVAILSAVYASLSTTRAHGTCSQRERQDAQTAKTATGNLSGGVLGALGLLAIHQGVSHDE